MFALRFLPFRINLAVTGITGLQSRIIRKLDFQRCVNTFMASLTVLGRLCLVMAIVTLRTIRDIAVFFMMTSLTALLRMHAGEPGQFFFGAGMAISAGFTQSLHGRHLQWRMRILVTADAIRLLWTVLLAMTGRTEGHQIGIVVFTRVVCVKNLVALLAGETMLAA